jgi:3-methyladenine DNA glycosylase AlkC
MLLQNTKISFAKNRVTQKSHPLKKSIKPTAPSGFAAALAPTARIGARTVATIDPNVLKQLEAGEIETANLTEGLGINMNRLMSAVAPSLGKNLIDSELGIVQRMTQAGLLLRQARLNLGDHASDTVRGWASFAIGQDQNIEPMKRLASMRPFAADSHFGVREWAWMAVRAIVVADPIASIKVLSPWVLDKDANVRRFASEATRPRGVWAASIPILRKEPHLALPMLKELRFDAERYVEDSVANWLNDATKDQPDWVRQLLAQWEEEGVADRLIKRASRSLKS